MNLENSNNKKMSLTRQSQILILGHAAAFSFNFLVPIIVVRYFDVAQFGVYKQLFLVFMTMTLILPFGIVESLYYFIPREREASQHYIMQTVSFLILAGLLYLIFILSLGDHVFAYLNLSHLYKYSLPLSLYIIFMSISLPFEKLLIIKERVTQSSLITMASEMLKGVCIISSTIITGNLTIILYSLVLFSFARMIIFLGYLAKSHLLYLSFGKFDLYRIREQLRYALPFGLGVIVATLRRFLHQYFVSFLFATKDFAIYAAGSFQLPLMNVIFTSVSNVVLIRISEYQKQKRYDEILEIWHNSSRKLALIYFPLTVLFIISSGEFITVIFTDRYLDSVPIFIVTLMQIPFNVFITHSVLKAFAETKFIFKLNLIFLILTTLFVYISIELWGMIGASIGTVLSFAMLRVIETLKIKNLLGVAYGKLIPWMLFVKIMSICLVCALLTAVISKFTTFSVPLYMLILKLVLFTLIYILIVYKSDLLMKSEKKDIRTAINKVNFIHRNV